MTHRGIIDFPSPSEPWSMRNFMLNPDLNLTERHRILRNT